LLRAIRAFFRRTDGQDLAEYCLLLAFIGLVALGFVVNSMGGIQGIWNSANTSLATASTTASGDAGSSTGGGPSGGGGGGDHGGHGDGHGDGDHQD